MPRMYHMQALGDINPGEPRIYDENILKITAKCVHCKFLEARYKTPCVLIFGIEHILTSQMTSQYIFFSICCHKVRKKSNCNVVSGK